MMKIWACVVKDIKMAFKNYYIYFTLGFAVVFVLLAAFVIPAEDSARGSFVLFIEDNASLGGLLDNLSGDMQDAKVVSSLEEMKAVMEGDRTAVGLHLAMGDDGKLAFNFLLQGYESEQMRNIIRTGVEANYARAMGAEVQVEMVTLAPMAEKIPGNLAFLPIFLVMESAFMGFFMAAAYLFIDKEEGTIKAFAVTPGKVWEYLLSKVIVFMLFGWASGFIVTLALMGTGVNYLQFAIMLMVYSIVGTMLGLILASFFKSINSAMIWIILAMVILSFSVVSYFAPAFSPWYIRILPTYYMLNGFKDVLFGTGTNPGIAANILAYALLSLVLFFVAERLQRNKLAH
ncbi:MAG: ABC transporter permease [Clostridia bacterium]